MHHREQSTPRIGRLILFAVTVLLGSVIVSAVSWPAATVEANLEAALVFPVDVFPDLTFTQPTVITNVGDERLFITEQAGRIWVVKGQGTDATKSLFLDITGRVQDGCEMGLLGLAFHPQFAQNGYFYLNYNANIDGSYYSRISRFQVTADPDIADPQSELNFLEIKQPYCNHNGGDLHFDPQGMLVTSLGDGGIDIDPDTGEHQAQNPQTYLGKLLRIDVDGQEGGRNYAIPADNPFLDDAGTLDEIWAFGLRNPWRFSFDAQTGDLYVGDVGQDSWEEVNFVPTAATGGQNFEWSLKEGFSDFNLNQPVGPGAMTEPVYVYPHDDDEFCDSITGGYVYRGQQMKAFAGLYIYANFCDGRIYGLHRDQGDKWISSLLVDTDTVIVTFGEDQQNELYFADRENGRIYRLAADLSQQLYLPVILQ
jgi:glucose/arabinose dehydrogenase